MQDEIIKKKPLLEAILENGDWLIKNNQQNEIVREAVIEKVEKDQESYDNLTTKVDVRYNRLQNALLKSQEFETTFGEFNTTLSDLHHRLENAGELTVQFEQLSILKGEHEVRYSYFHCEHLYLGHS